MGMSKWKKPNGIIIELRDGKGTSDIALSMGWEKAAQKPKVKAKSKTKAKSKEV